MEEIRKSGWLSEKDGNRPKVWRVHTELSLVMECPRGRFRFTRIR